MIRQVLQKLGWRLFSLLAAFALWITFVGSPESVTSVSAPVEYQNLPGDLESVTELPQRIHVELRGPSARLRAASGANTAVVVDLNHIGPGERTISLEPDDVDLPAGLHAIRIVPSQLRLNFERRLERSVPVHARVAVPPPDGYRIARLDAQPAAMSILGPESRVRQALRAETDPIDLSHVVGKSSFQVHVFVDDPQVRFASAAVVQVNVELERIGQGGASTDGKTTVRH